MIEGDGRRVYFAGDTDLFDGMADLAPVDVALLPIWGWGPTMGPGHMDPARAAQAAALLRARLAIPIHWGTYYPIHLGLQGPAGVSRDAARALRAGDRGSTRHNGSPRPPAGGTDRDLRGGTLRRPREKGLDARVNGVMHPAGPDQGLDLHPPEGVAQLVRDPRELERDAVRPEPRDELFEHRRPRRVDVADRRAIDEDGSRRRIGP